ncbi:VirB4 family type IV secretion system protein [Clostridium estertheticum]|uniref:VirB4 family type IV secretion system protein n=1 Tax=Clostridium estertheticum TaxID=238834 RepID=UPI001C0C0771|nr:ATP-binding protein [Clostridium estertheticum]MBU3173285.1 ATP-binding protein [Clostridium estertheticum]
MATKKLQSRQVNNHILDVITPMGVEFHNTDFYFGDNLGRIILVTKYPSRVKIGWLSRLANMEGVTCSIHLEPTTDVNKLVDNISKSIGELGGKINNGGSALMLQRSEQQYKDAEQLLRKIDQEQENVFYVTIAIMVIAKDKIELEKKCRNVESKLAGSKMKGRSAMFRQEEALLAVSPYGTCPNVIREIANRNMPVSTVAGSFPFNASGLNDGSGFIFAKDKQGGLILIDIWRRGGDRTNSNFTILGAPGVGKSATVKKIFLNEYSQGTKIIIIDPEREYKDLCKNLHGQWINCGGGKGGRINPLQVKDVPIDDDDEEEDTILFTDEGKGMGTLALHFQTLRTFFSLYLKNIDDDLQATLEEVLEELYKSRGITWDTDTSKIPNEQYPILKDLYYLALKWAGIESENEDETENSEPKSEKELSELAKIEEKELAKISKFSQKKKDRCESIALKLRSSAIGADSALWNGTTTIEANADFIVLDTHDLQEADDKIKRTQYFNILTWAWQQLSKNREEKVMLGVDEAYLIVDPEVPQALQFLRNVSKRIRKYEGGLIVITHSVIDFLDPAVRRHGQALLDNPCYKFFMGSDGKALEELTKLMNLTEAEQEMLAKKKRGHGLLIAGSKRLHAIVDLAEHETVLFGKGGGK